VANPLQLTPGMLVGGDFRILRALSAGGMGAVYVAEQLSTGKQRALKVMHPQLVADEDLRMRFAREARVGSLIESEHVVEVIGAGVDEAGGNPWIAMELLQGADLARYIERRGRLEPQLAREVLRQLCHAMAAAHDAGVVHRDIKPENVFVARSKSANAPTSIKVLDFGIAKVAAAAKTTATANMGSPVWMAPEQTDPKAPIGPATDVWAIGLMTFWLLTGRVFWMTGNDPSASLHALMREMLFAPIPKASERAAELGVDDRWSDRFDPWFACCVSRDPALRFEDVRELFDGFELALGDWLGESAPASRGRALSHGVTLPSDSIQGPDSAPVRIVAASELSSDPALSLPPPSIEQPDAELPSSVHAASGMGATDSPTVSPPTKRGRVASNRLALAAVALLAIAVVALLGREPPPMFAARILPPPPTIAPPPPPMVSVAPEISAAPVESAAPSATASARPPPRVTAAPRGKPFNDKAARTVLRRAARVAQHACRNWKGDDVVAVAVTWNNDGSIAKVSVTGTANHSGRRHCAKPHFHATVPSYVGPPQTRTTSVAFLGKFGHGP
jgi:eukaryotic-like serine/threonine-protein kinase